MIQWRFVGPEAPCGSSPFPRRESSSSGHLEIAVTVNDPKAYTRPWTVTLNQLIMLNTELLDYHCMDNEKDAVHLLAK